MGRFHKALPNVRCAYVALQDFTPDLQILYTFFVFGLNVQVSVVKLPQWNGPFSQMFSQRQKRVCHFPKIYPRPPKYLHRYICHICDISQLWMKGTLKCQKYVMVDFKWVICCPKTHVNEITCGASLVTKYLIARSLLPGVRKKKKMKNTERLR